MASQKGDMFSVSQKTDESWPREGRSQGEKSVQGREKASLKAKYLRPKDRAVARLESP